MKDYVVPFVAALAVWGLLFLGLDVVIMNAQGLNLIYQP
jgi:hypothetical protein